MGRDEIAVVDGDLKVYGIERLRIADASIMPRITTGNTMAPCVVIGERASKILQDEHAFMTKPILDAAMRNDISRSARTSARPPFAASTKG